MSAPEIHLDPLPYTERLELRDPATIDLVVIHCTELPDIAMAREYGERVHYPATETGNSGHYYVERSGRLQQWVPLERIAHHVRGYNECSIGVELMNVGRYPNWLDSRHQAMTEAYPEPQLCSLLELLSLLRSQIPKLHWIAGHEALDTRYVPATDDPDRRVLRKRDPGPLFPWPRILAESGLAMLSPDSYPSNSD